MNKRKLFLGLLLLILAAALVDAVRESPRQQSVAPATTRAVSAPSAPAPGATAADFADARLQLELLNHEQQGFPGVRRDIFSSAKIYPAPLPPPVVPREVESVASAEAVPGPDPGAAMAPSLTRDLAQFTFLGFLQKGGAKMLFLSSPDGIFIARQGDRFGKSKEFTVTDIAPEKLLIRRGDSPAIITVSLVEQNPLAPLAWNPPPKPKQQPSQRRPVPGIESDPINEGQGEEEGAPMENESHESKSMESDASLPDEDPDA